MCLSVCLSTCISRKFSVPPPRGGPHHSHGSVLLWQCSVPWVELSRFYRPTKHIIGRIRDGFYGSNDPTNSVKALKEVVVLRIRLQSHQVHLTMLQYYNMQYSDTRNTYTKMNLSTVKWAQWDKTQSRELLVLFICVCISLCTIVAHITAQNRPDIFPSYPSDNHHCSNDVYLREGVRMCHVLPV